MTIVHWDDVEAREQRSGDIGGLWQQLGGAAGSVGVGLNRVRVPAGSRSTAVHTHGASEEAFVVLAGSGLLWQDGRTAASGPGDCIHHLPQVDDHTLVAGEDGLEYLVYGTRHPTEFGSLLRARGIRLGPDWVRAEAEADPWQLDVDAGPFVVPEPGERPPNVLALADAESTFGGMVRDLVPGAVKAGLKHVTLPPDVGGAPAHCHSAEEELFVVLDGTATLQLHPRGGEGEPEEHELRRGHVVARPPGTGVAHAFRAGPEGVVYLAYGTRVPSDMTFYPAERRVALRGLGVSFLLPS
jgi:uncharacterized cupin superfamily protein